MTLTAWIIIILALTSIVGGILVLRDSAKKFNLSDEQLSRIKKRNKILDEQEEND